MEMFGRRMIGLNAIALVSLVVLRGPHMLCLFLGACFATNGALGVVLTLPNRKTAVVRDPIVRAFAHSWALMVPALTQYVGPFSPVVIILAAGVLLFGFSVDRVVSIGAPAVAILGFVAVGVLVSVEVLPSDGFFSAQPSSLAIRLIALAFVPVILGSGLWQTHVWRGTLVDAFERVFLATSLARQHQAERDEARIDLEQLLQAAAGNPGPWTGRLAARYQLGAVIGRGGMGEVYAAQHVDTHQHAAVKLMHASSLERPALRSWFYREMSIAKRLIAPNLVRVDEVGEIQEGVPFIAMERLEGSDLATVLRNQRLSLPEIAELIRQVAAGLDAAHHAGIVHRDLKPQNIFRSAAPQGPVWKILDFGVSKVIGEGTLAGGGIVGTIGYLAPEQVSGNATAVSDIFSLGAIAYRAITGRVPFSGDCPESSLQAVLHHTPTPPSQLVAVPRDVDLVLGIALAKQPSRRFFTAGQFATAFVAATRGALDPALRTRSLSVEDPLTTVTHAEPPKLMAAVHPHPLTRRESR